MPSAAARERDRLEWDAGLRIRSRGVAHRARAVILALPPASLEALGAELWSRAQQRALATFAESRQTHWRSGVVVAAGRGPIVADAPPFFALRISRERSSTVAALCIDRERGEVQVSLRAGEPAAHTEVVREVRALVPSLELPVDGAAFEAVLRPRFDVGAYRSMERTRRLLAEIPSLFVAGGGVE